MDREPDEIADAFIRPLDAILRGDDLGSVESHSARDLLSVDVRLAVRGMAGFDRALEFLVETDAPIGTVVYRLSWWGSKKDIVVLGPC